MLSIFSNALYDHGWAIVSGLIGGTLAVTAGALLKAFAGEKGKLLALTRNLEEVKEHLSQTTTVAKNIENKLSGDLWEQQHRWEAKREFYSDVVVSAEKATRAGHALERHLKQGLSYDQTTHGEFEASLNALENAFVERYQKLEMVIVKGRLFVDRSVVEEWKQLQAAWASSVPKDDPQKPFRDFGKSHTGLLQDRIKEEREYIPVMINSIATMRERMFAIAEKDLRLGRGPQAAP